jgi:hypothetical protein
MKKVFFGALAFCALPLMATDVNFASPNGRIAVKVSDDGGRLTYAVKVDGKDFLLPSPLGMKTDLGDFTQQLSLKAGEQSAKTYSYDVPTGKRRHVSGEATCVQVEALQGDRHVFEVHFQVTNTDVAFRYTFTPFRDRLSMRITEEASGFVFPEGTTTFLCPQSIPMGGFARTYPSYETPYKLDDKMGDNGHGAGYSFPCLFRNGSNGWLLVSETGVDGHYVASHLANVNQGNAYAIAFPQQGEMNGWGTTDALIELPGSTPWRTITLGTTLAPIVETTIYTDLVQPKYSPSKVYEGGRGTWSWIIGQDNSCNYDEQKRYIDFAAAMGYESVLIDALWDTKIGYARMEELVRYAASKKVGIFLWYNSNGYWNDAPQGPRNRMHTSLVRNEEMAWMQKVGVRGIKVDFFGGDKQPMIQIYEDILADANRYGIQVIFHGCTLPRGWERMYPNFVASEAVLASENMHFGQGACDAEAMNGCIHPFIRNAVGAMDFGGSTLNKRYRPDNRRGTIRRTSDVYALASAVLFQSPVQHFALAPNNLTDAPAWAIDFMKEVPTMWDDIRFIDGYPGRYVILARRHGAKWYVAAANAEATPLKKKITLPMLTGSAATLYSDDAQLQGSRSSVKLNKKRELTVTIPQNGGWLLVAE